MLKDFFISLKYPLLQALVGGIITWLLTLIGATFIFFNKKPSKSLFSFMLSSAGGIMLAASFWSLLLPAKEYSIENNLSPWITLTSGFILGTLFLFILDKIIPHEHLEENGEIEGIKTNLKKTWLFVFAVILHNIPEGLAVGVAFGTLANNVNDPKLLLSAISLTIGIGLQNIPEGLAIALPLYANGFSKKKSFFFGQISAIVEPISAIFGALFVTIFTNLLPYAMSFAAGAMIYIIVEDVIPEFQENKTNDIAIIFFIIGFLIMTILDISLG